jgi:hypothetical protein
MELKKPYTRPHLRKLGLLRRVTRFSFGGCNAEKACSW